MSEPAHLDRLAREAEIEFFNRFGREPRFLVAAPGRVNLIGEHTDYNEGFVLPLAIDRHVVIAADRCESGEAPRAAFASTAAQDAVAIPLAGRIERGPESWGNYVRGVIAGFQERGLHPGPFDALVHSDVPLGGGLSSSAALEVAVATLLEALTGHALEPFTKVLLCQKAEHQYAGVPCGIMDQCSSVLGRADHLLLLDCRSLGVQYIPLEDPELRILILNSHVKHALHDGDYAERRRSCEQAAAQIGVKSLRDVPVENFAIMSLPLDDTRRKRARHVVSEIARTLEAADAIRQADWPTVGRLMAESHESLRDDFEVSCPELDVLVAAAQALGPEQGVIGSRMTGGGFGGCTVSLVRAGQCASVASTIQQQYRDVTGLEATAFVTRPATGARVLRAP